MLKQRTITVDGQKIVIKSRVKTHLGNHNGFGVNINGKQYDGFSFLLRSEAEDWAFARWVKEEAA